MGPAIALSILLVAVVGPGVGVVVGHLQLFTQARQFGLQLGDHWRVCRLGVHAAHLVRIAPAIE